MPNIDPHPPGPGETVIRRTTTSLSGKIPWLPLILAALIVPLLLTSLATLTGIGKRNGIQDDLSARSVQALQAQGYSDAEVSFEGRDGTISGVPAEHAQHAKDAVLGVDGVRVVDVEGVGGGGGGGGGGESAPSPLTIDADSDQVTLNGEVPDDATKSAMVAAAEAQAGEREVVDKLTVDESTSELQAALKKLIDAQGINFAPNSSRLTEASVATLRKVSSELKKAPRAKIRVDGHVANVSGGEPDPQTLSEMRAESVKKQLVEFGISASRITTKGFGGSKPVATNKTSEGQAANRRVEIVVL